MRLSKWLLFIVILLAVIGLCACKSRTAGRSESSESSVSSEEPESSKASVPELVPEPKLEPVSQPASEDKLAVYDTTDGFLRGAKTGERAVIQNYADYNSLFQLQEGQSPDWIFGQILMRMKYEIIQTEIKDDTALVNVKFSNVDMGAVIPVYFEEALKLEYDNGLSEAPLDAEQMEKEYRRVFAALISGNGEARVEITADVELEKEGETWKIKPNSTLGNAMLGGYIEAQNRFSPQSHYPAEGDMHDPSHSGAENEDHNPAHDEDVGESHSAEVSEGEKDAQ